MAGETTITIVGNLTADPEMRFTSSGVAVASFTIASTPRSFNRQTNQWEDGEALFMRCSVWREAAENVAETLTKGMRVIAQGRLQQRSYTDREGQQRTVIDMQVDEIGPSLRYAKAQVTRQSRGGNGGGFGGGAGAPAPVQQGGGFGGQGYGQPQGYGAQASYNAPQGGAQDDPWATGGTYASDEPPF